MVCLEKARHDKTAPEKKGKGKIGPEVVVDLM
jgi:hypothetical protein